jgi:spore maturation protein CgeB
MRLVIFGLTVSSSWGNGHATLWRALLRALHERGHHVTFFERDVPYYAAHRDLSAIDGHALCLYTKWDDAVVLAEDALKRADAAIITSYCPDARAAAALVLDGPTPRRVFYDLDTPVTLAALRRGEPVDYLPTEGLSAFDLVLSFAGGPALADLGVRLGAKRVAPLFGSVDTRCYQRTDTVAAYQADLTYLGTYAGDRQDALDALLLEPARRRPNMRFLIGGSMYPADFPWTPNLYYVRHVAPPDHSKFYSSGRVTLNVTRGPMAEMGFCPSGRLFEAAACGTPVMSDMWPGLESFFEPDREILIARSSEEALEVLDRSPDALAAIGQRAKARALSCHSAERRAEELEHILGSM